MKISVFCCFNDNKVYDSFYNDPSINLFNLRSLTGRDYLDNSVILISEHSTNRRIIHYVRSFNVLTPIYIVSNKSLYLNGSNGCINDYELTAQSLRDLLLVFPQRNIWNFVFQLDYNKRQKQLTQSSLI